MPSSTGTRPVVSPLTIMRKILGRGRKRSELVRRSSRTDKVPLPDRRPVADGPAPSVPAEPERLAAAARPPVRTIAQARKDANSIRVVAEALRDQSFLSLLQRVVPRLVQQYMITKSKSRGCGGCGMKSLFHNIAQEIRNRHEQDSMTEVTGYLRERGWS